MTWQEDESDARSERRATIGPGYVLLVGAASGDDESNVRRLADKVIDLRVFADAEGRMNLSLVDVGAAALIVSQFTLFADMSRGRRPSSRRRRATERACRQTCKRVAEPATRRSGA